APLRHPLGFALLRRQGADHVLVQARRQRIGFDVGDEAGVVAAPELLVDFLVGDDGFCELGGHRAACGVHALARRAWMRRPVSGWGGATSPSICARLTLRSAAATTSLMRRQLPRTPHCPEMPHSPWSRLHSVIASGPSIASTISTRLIASAGRARR